MDFVAIDIETPNHNQDSICSVGALRFTNGNPHHESFYELIDPEQDFDEHNINIHRIQPADIKDKPTFEDIWPQLSEYLGQSILVAHNAFTVEHAILNKCLKRCGHPKLKDNFLCTYKMAKCVLPGAESHDLESLSNLFGLKLDHHDAYSDAKSCGHLAVLLLRAIDLKLTDELICDDVNTALDNWKRAHSFKNTSRKPTATGTIYSGRNSTPRDTIGVIEPDGRFDGLRFVITCDMERLDRDTAKGHITANGGKVVTSVSNKTNYVVVGQSSTCAHFKKGSAGKKTSKWQKGIDLEKEGKEIRVIFEERFVELLTCSNPEEFLDSLEPGSTDN